jgi:hypothetical protein
MEQSINSTKTPARPSHEAVENKIGANPLTDKSEEQKMDQVAMKAAKRAENRFAADEENVPGSTIFTK